MASTGVASAPSSRIAGPINLAAHARMVSGAKWFYWIAGLSIVNSMVALFGGELHFVVGLGITTVVDVLAKQAGAAGNVLDIVINGFVAGIFVLFGVFAQKAQKWAFVVGMGLYVLDALLLLLVKDIFSVAFHAYALFCIYRGMSAVGQISQPAPLPGMSAPIQPR